MKNIFKEKNQISLQKKLNWINFQLNNNPENKYIKTVINLESLKNLNFEKCNSIKIENLTNKENYLINFVRKEQYMIRNFFYFLILKS